MLRPIATLSENDRKRMKPQSATVAIGKPASGGARAAWIEVLFIIVPHSMLLDIAGPAEAFRLANLNLALRGQPARYRLRFCGPVAAAPSSVGLALRSKRAKRRRVRFFRYAGLARTA